jgi:gamma-glutamylcysteine synthetase
MSLDLGTLSAPVANLDELVAYIKGAERPPERWLVGVEHEKIGVRGPRFEPVPYHGPGGIRELLDAIARSAGGTQHKHKENGQPIALLSKDASVTLEPGGQLELSGAPHAPWPRSAPRSTRTSRRCAATRMASPGWRRAIGPSERVRTFPGCRRDAMRR